MGGFAQSIGGMLGLSGNPNQVTAQTGNSFLGNIDPAIQSGQAQLNGQLGTSQGLESGQAGILNNLQNQGFNLQPQDQSLYGQEAGNISRQFGQAGNSMANNLAQRGLSDSGAAGAMFSGLQGSQNEQLAGAQQQIAQQRFQNTQNQIAQQQQFLGNLNGQNNQMAGNAANFGVNSQVAGAGAQNQANQVANSGNVSVANTNAANAPSNLIDMMSPGMVQKAGQSLFQGGGSSGGGGGGGAAAAALK